MFLEGTVITDVHCAFWGDSEGVFVTTYSEDSDSWKIVELDKTDGVQTEVLDQNIGVFGIDEMTYDATLS